MANSLLGSIIILLNVEATANNIEATANTLQASANNVEAEETPKPLVFNELQKLENQNRELIDDYTDDEVDVSKLNLKKMDLGSLEVEEINFDDDEFDFGTDELVEINEDNNLTIPSIKEEVKKELDTEQNIKKIVIDDNKSSTIKKYVKDSKKNFSFFE